MPVHSDYCPIALGVDVLGDRWTPLVIRELMVGADGFNEIHRGVPKMSRTLLAQRLRALERHGLVVRQAAERGRPGRYALTAAGWAITPVIWAVGQWASEWLFDDPDDEDCDGLSLLWRMHQHAIAESLPAQRTLIHIVLTGPGAAEGWLDVERPTITVCRDEPGQEPDLTLTAPAREMHRWLVGKVPLRALLDSGEATLHGPPDLTRGFPAWFDTTVFAAGLGRAERRRAGLPMPGVGDVGTAGAAALADRHGDGLTRPETTRCG